MYPLFTTVYYVYVQFIYYLPCICLLFTKHISPVYHPYLCACLCVHCVPTVYDVRRLFVV